MKWLWCAAVVLITGCQMAPTKVGETQKREFDLLVDKTQRPIELTEQTVVLDARSNFEYGLNRVQNSVHFPWDALAETTQGGEVLKDLRKAALKLSLQGLQPGTPIVVVGNGPRGRGEEGRLAWTLLYLGFQDVQVAALETFRKNWTQSPSPQRQNVPVWPVHPRAEMQMAKTDFVKLSKDPKGRMEKRIFIIDVRSGSEYANRATTKAGPAPDINAMHMEWKEFFTENGRPHRAVKTKLQSLGITPNDRIILISNKGVRSGAVAYALLALGFSRVQNFTAGWNSLLTDRL